MFQIFSFTLRHKIKMYMKTVLFVLYALSLVKNGLIPSIQIPLARIKHPFATYC